MAETDPVPERVADALWHPSGWSLRTKISVVLLLPVIVAITLAGARIRGELDQANKLSTVRDQLPVLQGTIALADLIGREMVTAASAPGSAQLTSQISAVDAKVGAVQHAAEFARLPAETGRELNTALGRLGGLRTAGVTTDSDILAKTTGYRDIVFALSELVPTIIAPASTTDLDSTADTTRGLIQLRADLVVEESLLRVVQADSSARSLLAAAAHTSAEEGAISGEVQRGIAGGPAARFGSATTSAANRQDTLQTAQTTNRATDLPALLPPLVSEGSAIGGLVTELVGTLSATVGARTDQSRSDALRDTALVVAALLGALAVALMMARSLIGPVRRLHAAAVHTARHRLPETIDKVRAGEEVSWESVEPVGVTSGEEIGQLARAFDDMQRQAVRLAGEQAELRKQVSDMFMTLSRRSQSLVELQLSAIEDLEADEQDPQRLEELFRLDHIATRLRRNGENLQVLAGGSPVRRDHGPVSTVELLRAATSEVKDYRRVTLGNAPLGSVLSPAAADIVHILAELLENATRFSPPEAKVILTADRGADGGLLVEVVDSGLGMTAEDLEAANIRLAADDTVGPETTRRMGLFVVGRLAGLHGVTVRLRPTSGRSGRGSGITASVHVPGDLVVADGTPRAGHHQPPAPVPNGGSAPAARNGHAHGTLNGTINGTTNGTTVAGMPRRVAGQVPTTEYTDPANGIGLGRNRPVPPPVPPARTPIFDRVVSNWFNEAPPPDPTAPGPRPQPAAPPENWTSPADDAWRAAERAVGTHDPAHTTAAGLPARTPGARLAPGAAAPRHAAQQSGGQPTGFRDPAAVRNNLSRHYDGMRSARRHTAEPRHSQSGQSQPGNSQSGNSESANKGKADR
jgi:signal transduction histidine kinase